jgi:hypothetical protein
MSLSRHPNRREFDHLGHLFGILADDPNIEKILVKEVEKSDILKDVECDDLSYEDWDEDGPAGGTVDPAVETELVYELHEGDWIPKLRKVSRQFDELCDRFLSLYAAGFPKKSPSALKRESLEALDEFLGDHFWGEMPVELEGDLFRETYDEMRYECWDAAEERRDPYGYRGLSRRDFMASDRSRLIRLASTMAVGTPERKAILKGLSKRADLVGDLEAEFDSILAGHDANLDAASEFGMRSAHKRVANAAQAVREWEEAVEDVPRLDDEIYERLQALLMDAAKDSPSDWISGGDAKITEQIRYYSDKSGDTEFSDVEITFPDNYTSEEWVYVDLQGFYREIERKIVRAGLDGIFNRAPVEIISKYLDDLPLYDDLHEEDVQIDDAPDSIVDEASFYYYGAEDEESLVDQLERDVWAVVDEGVVEITRLKMTGPRRVQVLVRKEVRVEASLSGSYRMASTRRRG